MVFNYALQKNIYNYDPYVQLEIVPRIFMNFIYVFIFDNIINLKTIANF